MQLDFTAQALVDDDDTIRRNVSGVPAIPLLASVAHLTGELHILRDDLRPDPRKIGMAADDGYTKEQLAIAHTLAAEALIRYRDRGPSPATSLAPEQLRALIDFVVGRSVDDHYLKLLIEELALDGADFREPDWRFEDVRPGQSFNVAIIGAGLSGIAAAHRLRQAGVGVRVFEKNPDVGGTWLENHYPGCRVDLQNHFYSYSFAQSCHWPQLHSSQPVLLDYLQSCVVATGLSDAISYEAEVVSARWDEGRQLWELRIRDADGEERTEEANAVVSAVGQLNRPTLPDIEGIDTFGGQSFHSARWDHEVDITGKRVGVIGTGASAAQFIPWVAERAEHLTVHQRTPPWLVPVVGYQEDVPQDISWLLRHVPEYARWDRLRLMSRLQEGNLPRTVVDPDWDLSSGSVSASNDQVRQGLIGYYQHAFPDPDLRAKVLPSYPWGAKRMVVDDGSYSGALRRPNVSLETERIAAVTPAGVRMDDGRALEYDVVIYATGFSASDFLMPMSITGVNGTELHDRWKGDARAYLGITVPGFPNLFMMYGPNTNIAITGSVFFFSECEARYITESVRMLAENDSAAMDCRENVHDEYNEWIDDANDLRAWGVGTVNTWYRNKSGRVAQNWPFNLLTFWDKTLRPDPVDYELS
jgi:4-hydroxyacetophenone monooxygenase